MNQNIMNQAIAAQDSDHDLYDREAVDQYNDQIAALDGEWMLGGRVIVRRGGRFIGFKKEGGEL